MDVNIGKSLKERYVIKRKLSVGGMSNVYLAEDLILNRDVVLKIFYPNLFDSKKTETIFINEIKITTQLKHKNIVKLYDYFFFDGHWCLVLEYVQGQSLRELLTIKKNFSEKQTLNIVLQILDVLVFAHQKQIIHRDIKPENILIVAQKKVKILDFGVSVDTYFPSDIFKSKIIGSLKYVSPEVVANKKISFQSDLYSLGVVMFEMLVGEAPFVSKDTLELIKMHLYEPMPLVRNYDARISQKMENIIIKATAKNREERYANSQEMLMDVKNCFATSQPEAKRLLLKSPVFKENVKNPLFVPKIAKPRNFFWLHRGFLLPFFFLQWIVFLVLIIKLIVNWWST